MIRILLAAAVALAISLPAAAQSRWYLGASAGASKTHGELVFNRESTLVNFETVSTEFDERDGAWKAFAGWRLNPVIAFELAYANLGEHRIFSSIMGGTPVQPATFDLRRKISGYGLDIVATAPLGFERVRFFGRAGAFRARLVANAALGGNIVFSNGPPEQRSRSITLQETVFHAGLGVEWQLARNLALRAEYERYARIGRAFRVGGMGTTGEADTDVASLGIVATF